MSQLKRNIVANIAGKGWMALMSLAFVPVYIRFIGIEAYGLIGIFSALFSLFSILDLGLSTTLNRELARLSIQAGKAQEMRDLFKTLERVYWCLAGVIGIVVITLAPLITHHWVKADNLSTDTILQALMIMGVAIALQWPFSLYSGGLMGLQRQVLLNGITASVATVRGVGAVIVLWQISPTIQAFFLWQIVVSVAQTLMTAAFLWGCMPPSQQTTRFRKDLLFGVWRFAAGMTGISVTAIILTQLDKIILSNVLSLEMFGYYSLAGMVAGVLYYFVGPVFSALFPRFSQLVALNDIETLTPLYHRGCQLMSVLILPIAVVIALFSSELMWLWTGNRTIAENTHLILSLLIVGTALNGLMNLPLALQLAHGWTRLIFYSNVIAVIVLAPFIFLMASRFGAVGAAAVWVVLNSGYVLFLLQVMHRKLLQGERWRWYAIDVGLPLGAALITGGLARWAIELPLTRPSAALSLAGLAMLTYLCSAMVAPQIREWIFVQLFRRAAPNKRI